MFGAEVRRGKEQREGGSSRIIKYDPRCGGYWSSGRARHSISEGVDYSGSLLGASPLKERALCPVVGWLVPAGAAFRALGVRCAQLLGSCDPCRIHKAPSPSSLGTEDRYDDKSSALSNIGASHCPLCLPIFILSAQGMALAQHIRHLSSVSSLRRGLSHAVSRHPAIWNPNKQGEIVNTATAHHSVPKLPVQ